MKLTYPADQVHNPFQILRKAGYKHFIDPVTKKESYILHLTNGFYPRFHIYMKTEDNQLTIDLHLDQKKPSYAGSNAHGGEYDGPQVEKELQRIAGWVFHLSGIQADGLHTREKEPEAVDEEQIHESKEELPPTEENDLFSGIFG